MKNTLIILAGLLLIVLAGFYYYSLTINKPTSAALLDLVPSDAVFIYENKKPAYTKKETPDLATWLRKALKEDSVFISPLRTKEVLASLHITGKKDFGILYYLTDSSILTDIAFKKLLTNGKIKRRNFQGYPISELPAARQRTISYTTVGKAIILSRQSLLIEDVIRSQNEEENGFRKKNDELFHLMPLDAGQGKLYASVNALATFTGLFFDDELKSDLFRNLGSSVIADAKIENQTLTLNGFATDSAAHGPSILSLFNDQHPAASEIQKIVSSRSLFFVHYGIPDFKTWSKNRTAFQPNQPPATSTASDKKNKSSDFYACMDDESGTCYLSGAKGETDEIMIVKIKKDHADKAVSILSGDQQPLENYSNYQIYPVLSPAGIRDLLWPLSEMHTTAFYTRHDQWLIFAENIDVLKGFINDIEEDNTWGKSAEWNTFFNSVSLETNLSLEFNGTLLMPWIANKINPRWDSLNLPREWTTLQKGSFQFSRLNHSYYFNGVLQFDAQKKGSHKTNVASSSPGISFSDNITSLTLVRNHNSNATELLVQTADKTLMLLTTDFKVLFKTVLKEAIKGQVVQIDYLKNKKLQYLFLAGHSLYLIDRLGNDVKGYPQVIETAAEPEFLSVLDYDNTRNYRFLIADAKGNLQMKDREGKLLEGWTDRSAGAKLFKAPRPVRTAGKDFIVAIDEQGVIQAFNRKGESISGFPMSAGIRPQGDWYFERNSGNGDLITLVSSDGVKVQVNLKGKIVNKENYVRSAPDSKFSLMISSASDDYAISRIDKAKIAVLSRKGEIIFEMANPGSIVAESAFYAPASGEKIFCFRDSQQDFTYLFNDQGQPVFSRPLESSQLPKMIRRKDGLVVFTILNHDLAKNSP